MALIAYNPFFESTPESHKKFKRLEAEGVKGCKARSGELRCVLENIHTMLGTAHLHRHPDGRLESFE